MALNFFTELLAHGVEVPNKVMLDMLNQEQQRRKRIHDSEDDDEDDEQQPRKQAKTKPVRWSLSLLSKKKHLNY